MLLFVQNAQNHIISETQKQSYKNTNNNNKKCIVINKKHKNTHIISEKHNHIIYKYTKTII